MCGLAAIVAQRVVTRTLHAKVLWTMCEFVGGVAACSIVVGIVVVVACARCYAGAARQSVVDNV